MRGGGRLRYAWALAVALAPGACAHQPPAAHPTFHHVVLVWLEQGGDPGHRRVVIDASRALADIPGVLEVEAGTAVPSSREIVDDSFDVGIHMTFPNEGVMSTYLEHPGHVETVEEVIAPLARRITVYDFRE